MADEDEDFTDELQQVDGEGGEGLPAEEHDELEEGADAAVNVGRGEEGDDEPGAGGQAGAKADQSQGAQDNRGLSRGASHQARLRKELQDLKERDLAREREFNELKGRLQQAAQPRGESPEQRQARLDAMTTEERLTYLWQESEQRNQQQRQYDQFMNNDRADQQTYAALAAADKRAAKYRDEVEATLRTFRQNGVNPAREHVYYYVLGQKVAKARKAAAGQTEGVARRQAASRTSPATTGGDVGRAQRGRNLEQKLDGVLL